MNDKSLEDIIRQQNHLRQKLEDIFVEIKCNPADPVAKAALTRQWMLAIIGLFLDYQAE